MNAPRAKVFISCGQREGEERETAVRVGEVLTELGYEYYIAANEASLTGLKENVYRQLEDSEYIVFVDFRREELSNTDKSRGSLSAIRNWQWLPISESIGSLCSRRAWSVMES